MSEFLRKLFPAAINAAHDLEVPVIAEVAWAHDGSVELGKVIVNGAADAGVAAINFHVTDLGDYMTPFYGAGPGRVSGGQDIGNVYTYLEKINLSNEQTGELVKYAKSKKLAVSLMPNDFPSLKFSADQADMLTIHPSCVFDEAYLRAAASTKLPMMLYTGGLQIGEVDKIINWSVKEGNDRLILQYGFQSYPTPIELNRLRYIETLKRAFGRPISFADHTDGDDPMAYIVPLLAVAAGAELIEKHMTHDRLKKGEDFEAALDPKGMKTFMHQVRLSLQALGNGKAGPLGAGELRYRGVVRKRAVLAKAVKKGTPLTKDLVSYRRSDAGLYPEEIEPLFGHVSIAADAQENAALDWPLFARVGAV
jgi:sialic acid synthase SpsE